MQVKHVIRSMTRDGENEREEFVTIDDSIAAYNKKNLSGKYRYLDLEIHTIVTLKKVF